MKYEGANIAVAKFAAGAGGPASVIPSEEVEPASLLAQNHPNPFHSTSTIEFTVTGGGEVTLKLFDLLGRTVAIPVDEPLQPGSYQVTIDAAALAPGTYFYRLEENGYAVTRQCTVME
jgi:hypothetical protein